MLGEKGDQSGSGTKESSSAAGGIGDSAATTSSSSATLALSGIEHPGMNGRFVVQSVN